VAPALAAAEAAHVPVMTVDRNINGKVVTYVGRDNRKMGELSARALVARLVHNGKPHAQIIEIPAVPSWRRGATGSTLSSRLPA